MLYIGLSFWLYYNNLVEIVWGKKWWCLNINYMTALIVLNASPMYSQVVHIVCKMHVLINGCKLFAKSVKDKRKISTILIFVLKQEAVCRLTQCHSKCFPTMLQSINDITNTRWKSNDCRHHMHDLLQSIPLVNRLFNDREGVCAHVWLRLYNAIKRSKIALLICIAQPWWKQQPDHCVRCCERP